MQAKERSQGQILLSGLSQGTHPAGLGLSLSSLQNCEGIMLVFKPPGGSVAVAAPAH